MINKVMMRVAKYFSVAMLIFTTLQTLLGSYHFGFFDSALAQASINYVKQGLVPYRDFGVVYPPGLFLLFGRVLGVTNIGQIQIWGFLICLFLYTLILKYLSELSKRSDTKDWNYFLFNTLVAILLLSQTFYALILSLSVALIFCLICQLRIKAELRSRLILGVLSAGLVWVRWDFSLGILIALSILAVFDKKTWRVFSTMFVGVVAGIITLYNYLFQNHVVNQFLLFVIRIPTMLASGPRALSWPTHIGLNAPDLVIYPLILLVAYLVLEMSKTLFKERIQIFYIAFMLAFVPYAAGRSDFGHFLPLLLAATLVGILISHKLNKRLYIILSIMCFLPVGPWFIKNTDFLTLHPKTVETELDNQLAECKKVINKVAARSIFVGRKSYNKYRFNIAALYLASPDTHPASRFISDEPGLQSDCEYGEEIVGELKHAPRPMLVLADQSEQSPENSFMRKMKSCGKIETYLSDIPSISLGTCDSFYSTFEVKVYY